MIVPYDEDAGQMIRDLNGDLEFGQMQKLLRSVQKYTVSVYAGDKRKLAEAGALCRCIAERWHWKRTSMTRQRWDC